MGNSEVGHLNLGAGAVVRQDLVRIDDAIADGSFAENHVLREALVGAPGSAAPARVHLLGLVSDGGVHSSLEHLRALIEMARRLEVEDLVVHAFTDGRDTLPHAGAGYLAELDRTPSVRVGSVVGRYWAMDRDRRWDRTQRAYDMLVHGRAPHQAPPAASRRCLPPTRGGRRMSSSSPRSLARRRGSGRATACIAFNFRPDRMRQLTRALAEPGFGSGTGGAGGAARLERARRRAAGRALCDVHRVRGGLALSGRVPARAPADDAFGGARRRRRHTAARGRDREVSPRHLLLQRRRGGAARRASGASWWTRRATCPRTTTSRR